MKALTIGALAMSLYGLYLLGRPAPRMREADGKTVIGWAIARNSRVPPEQAKHMAEQVFWDAFPYSPVDLNKRDTWVFVRPVDIPPGEYTMKHIVLREFGALRIHATVRLLLRESLIECGSVAPACIYVADGATNVQIQGSTFHGPW